MNLNKTEGDLTNEYCIETATIYTGLEKIDDGFIRFNKQINERVPSLAR